MPLDGLRAWIGEVERKLGMRTRVFLVLTVIAVGGAGAAVYLAVEANRTAVSEGDVQALQEKLEARIDEGSGEGTSGGSSEGTSEGAPEGTSGGAAGAGANSAKLQKRLEQTQKQNEQAENEGAHR